MQKIQLFHIGLQYNQQINYIIVSALPNAAYLAFQHTVNIIQK